MERLPQALAGRRARFWRALNFLLLSSGHIRYVHLSPVFGYSPPGDGTAGLGHETGQLLVGQGAAGVLLVDELLQHQPGGGPSHL